MIAFPASLLILNGKSADNLPLRDAIAQLRNESVGARDFAIGNGK